MKKSSGYVKKLPRGVVNRGSGIFDDIVSGITYIYDKAKDAYQWFKKQRPISKTYDFLGESGREIVGNLPLIGQPINTALKLGHNYGFQRKRKVGRPKKK